MSDIGKMDFKQLRKEVQLLRDELAIMKRKYEDILYNLDDENFCSRIIKEKDDMKAEISITAEGIKTKVSATDLTNALEGYSTFSQTASAISAVVSRGADVKNAIEITDLSEAIDKTKTYKIVTYGSREGSDGASEIIATEETYYFYNTLSKQWEKISGDTIYTMFEQTSEGFVLKGNTVIDGNTTITRNLTLSGNVTWDMSNSPVKTEYSNDKIHWHAGQNNDDLYMHMSFDGGISWSTPPTKIVGTDGRDGNNGSDANVTPENVFNALTDEGANQGIFAAFINNNNKIYINAEMLSAKIAEVANIIYLGDSVDSGQKKIVLNDNVTISSEEYDIGGYHGLSLSALSVSIGSKLTSRGDLRVLGDLDLSNCTGINWGVHEPSSVAVFG